MLLHCSCYRRPTFFILLILILFYGLNGQAQTQSKLNYGLSKPQDAATLPQSRAQYIMPVLKTKVNTKTILQPLANGEFNITNGWELAAGPGIKANGQALSKPNYNTKAWYNAVVPGTILTSLVQQGVYPDPYFGLNNLHIPDSLCREDWWYRTSFIIPANHQNENAYLNFDGINYAAEIWLNGKMIGTIKGAFKRSVFNILGYVNKNGTNVLAVHILPPPDPGIPQEESPSAGTGPNGGQLCLDGPTFIATEGWDWIPGIRDRDMGIWQNVTLKFTKSITISDTRIVTRLPLPDTTSATVYVETNVQNTSTQKQHVVIKAEFGSVKIQQVISLNPNENKIISFTPDDFKALNINHPKLWWPNGYGNPALYKLKLSTITNGRSSDQQTTCFGIRELSYEMTVDMPDNTRKRLEYQPSSDLKNKTSVFDNVDRAKVQNNVTIARLKPDVETAALKPCNDTQTAPYLVIKVNGRRIYCKGGNWGMDDAMKNVSRQHLEPYFKLHKDAHFNMIRNWTGENTEQTFYDMCDKYGMLVWNDFWLSTQGYNLDVKDDSLFLSNARDVIKRFRNHPSIAIWCPRNEGYAPKGIESKLADIVAQYDGTRYYQPNSRLMNLRTSGPWNYFTDPGDYESIAGGFNTELGSPSVPTASTMEKMMGKQDLWPISDVWYYHDWHDGQKNYVAAMDSLYGKATSLNDFCKKAQMLNYDSYRAMFEGWESKLWNNTTGLLLWMSHPAWPSTDWQTYSWDYETFGSYFGSMKACEPLHVQMSLNDGQISIINTSLKNFSAGKVLMQLYDLGGKLVYSTTMDANVNANSAVKLKKPQLPTGLSGVYLTRLKLMDANDMLRSQNDYWKTLGSTKNFIAFNNLPNVNLSVKKIDKNHYKLVNLTSTPAIAIKLNLVNILTRQIILPANFSDGYFNLLPGESKLINVVQAGRQKASLMISGYNIE
jgi:hypothetical protein